MTVVCEWRRRRIGLQKDDMVLHTRTHTPYGPFAQKHYVGNADAEREPEIDKNLLPNANVK